MKITIENTTKLVTLNGVPARLWEGKTDSGIPVHCFITRIGVANSENTDEFERELKAEKSPSPEFEAIALRLII